MSTRMRTRSSQRTRLVVDFDPNIDLSNGRADLNKVNLRTFRESPAFGQGADEARQLVPGSDSVAKSEHGYTVHLASYGLFGLLFFAYVAAGLVASASCCCGGRAVPASRSRPG